MSELVQLKVNGLSKIVGSDDLVLIVLTDQLATRQLVVPCDEHMGFQLRLRMDASLHVHTDRMLPEVLVGLMGDNFKTEYHFLISALKDGKYLGKLVNNQTGETRDMRCADGILLSLVTSIPIFIEASLLKMQAARMDGDMMQVPLPINVVTDDMLQQSLKHAIESEDYEMASSLRDEIKKRHERKKRNEGKQQ